MVWGIKAKHHAIMRQVALNDMMRALELGDLPARVREVFTLNRTYDMRLREVSSNAWIIEEPPDWTTTPANLYVDFATGKISRLRIRFHRDTNMQPASAGNDKQ